MEVCPMDGVVSSSNQVTNNERHDREDTEGDSDASTPDKSQTKPEYREPGKFKITMSFLEDGGYFDVPIKVASTRIGLGVTTLKRVCRANNMRRWPFCKRKSLGNLIDRTKQVLDDGTGQNHMQKLAALQVLEKQRQVMRGSQSQDMEDKIKCYRQAIFKLNHQERRRRENATSRGSTASSVTVIMLAQFGSYGFVVGLWIPLAV
ncbi:TPA: hypothetical protein ACH3X2_006259 [Trebouxia sp. C0005]